MGEVREAAIKALKRLGLHYLLADGGDTVVVPWGLGDENVRLVAVEPLEEAKEALMWCDVCTVPLSKQAEVALLLAKLNAERKFTVFSLKEERVVLDICTELSCVGDEGQEAMLALSLSRLIKAWPPSGKWFRARCRRTSERSYKPCWGARWPRHRWRPSHPRP